MDAKEQKEILGAFRKVSKTPAGIIVFRYLMEILGYKSSSIVMRKDTHEVLMDALVNNEARRNVWLELRRIIPAEQLNVIEREKEPNDDIELG